MQEIEILYKIRLRLLKEKDEGYRAFQGALIPTVPSDRIIGVRTPALRAMAKELSKDKEITLFLSDLPHTYFDEDQLHAFVISGIKDFDFCLAEVERFLPFVDNWATCDQMSPPVFKKNKERLLPKVREWLASSHPFTVRFGIKTLMDCFLGEDFDPAFPEWVAAIRSEEYYVNMMAAWYFATALAKNEREVHPYFEGGRLSPVVRKKAVQKALESYRIPEVTKAWLRKSRSQEK